MTWSTMRSTPLVSGMCYGRIHTWSAGLSSSRAKLLSLLDTGTGLQDSRAEETQGRHSVTLMLLPAAHAWAEKFFGRAAQGREVRRQLVG